MNTFLWTFICTVSVFRKRDDLSIYFDLRHYFSCNWCMDIFDGFTRKQTVPCFLYLRKLEETAHVFRIGACIFRWIFKMKVNSVLFTLSIWENYIYQLLTVDFVYIVDVVFIIYSYVYWQKLSCVKDGKDRRHLYDCSHFCGMKTFVKMSFNCFIIEFDTCFEFHN